MFKKVVFSLTFFALLFPSSTHARTPVSSEVTNNQYYTVAFDGEGEAAVAARIDLVNTSKTTLTSVVLEIPGKSLRVINAVQGLNVGYRYQTPMETPGVGMSYPSYNYGYYSLDPEQVSTPTGFLVTLRLNNSLSQQETTTLLLYYKVSGYTKNFLGLRSFAFQTIKTDYDVASVRVAVNAQEPFKIKGTRASTNYLPNVSALEAGKTYSGVADSSLSQFSSIVTTQPGFVKTTQSLDPGENFVVKGSYAESVVLLYLTDIVKWLLIVGIGVAFFWFGYRWLRKKNMILNQLPTLNPLLKTTGGTLISNIVLIALFSGCFWLIERIGSQGGGSSLLAILILLLMFVFVTVFLFGAAVFFGIRYGIKYGIYSIATSVVFIIVAILFLFLNLSLLSNRVYPTDMPNI